MIIRSAAIAVWGLWNWKRIGTAGSMGKGFTFPVDGLSVYVVLPLETSTMDSDYPNTNTDTAVATELGYKASYFAAYTIKNIGAIKAGVQCKDKGYNKDGEEKVDYAIIDRAFDLPAIKNLSVSVGAFIPTAQVYIKGTHAVYG
jgi:hypothetical protein